jgi:hypothetical protein
MLKPATQPDDPVFVSMGDGAFRRYHRDGRPWDIALDQKGGLFEPALDPSKAAAIGQRRESMDQGGGGAISREHASQLHDLAAKANVPEADHQAFARVLATLCGGEPGGAADRGNGKISRARAAKAYDIAAPKLSPADLAEFVHLLKGMIDPNLPDEDEEAPGGQMATDEKARADFASRWPEISRIKIDTWGVPVPETKRDRQKLQMALDARPSGGAGEFLAGDPELDAMVKRIGRC